MKVAAGTSPRSFHAARDVDMIGTGPDGYKVAKPDVNGLWTDFATKRVRCSKIVDKKQRGLLYITEKPWMQL